MRLPNAPPPTAARSAPRPRRGAPTPRDAGSRAKRSRVRAARRRASGGSRTWQKCYNITSRLSSDAALRQRPVREPRQVEAGDVVEQFDEAARAVRERGLAFRGG